MEENAQQTVEHQSSLVLVVFDQLEWMELSSNITERMLHREDRIKEKIQ